MIKEIELSILPSHIHSREKILAQIAEYIQMDQSEIRDYRILKRSIDARSKQVVYKLKLDIFIDEEAPAPEVLHLEYPDIQNSPRVLVVGAGPAGMFAALRLIELGFKPVIIERGKDVRERRRDLAVLNKEGLINPESNYCFGEGGAGTYSDGKLYTRSTKRGDVDHILKTFVAHGADSSILIDARPHIGTNKLPGIIASIRDSILNAGAELYFNTRLTDLMIEDGKLKGIKTSTGNDLYADALILATGHSARDIFYLLDKKGILLEAKPFALGVRIEHPQEIIDQAQYHCRTRDENLTPAYYNLVEQIDGRGVFSFCMCPGGIIAPCATDINEIVVNGWSPSKRNNPFANSGTVVQIDLEDIPAFKKFGVMTALEFQKEVEQKAYQTGGGKLVAPAQRMLDFVNGKVSNDLPLNSYIPGTKSTDLKNVLPDFVHQRLRKALKEFGKKIKGYYTNEAILVGVESRTSSPVRIPRDKENLQHPGVKGLFPCGEGAGYAGGIVSAAIDGQRCAEAVAKLLS